MASAALGPLSTPAASVAAVVQAMAYSVYAFGAKGDGVADDTAAIQAALNAVAALGGGFVTMSAGTYLISGTIYIPNLVSLRGCGVQACIIMASATFPTTGAPLVQQGRISDSLVFGSRVSGIKIDANNVAGTICLYSTALQEGSGGSDLVLAHYMDKGLYLNGAGNSAYEYDQLHIYSGFGAVSATGIRADSNGFGQLRRITVNTSDAVAQGIGIYVNGSVIHIYDLHVEKHAQGVQFNGTGAGGTLRGMTCQTSITHMVQVNSSATKPIVLENLTPGAGTTDTINDLLTTQTVTGDVNRYSTLGLHAADVGNPHYRAFTATGAYAFTVPFGVTSLRVRVLGAGGSGGGGGADALTSGVGTQVGGGGAGAGQLLDFQVPVTPGASITGSVGVGPAGGAGGVLSVDTNGHAGTGGTQGGQSTAVIAGVTYTAQGGGGGAPGAAKSAATVAGGALGSGQNTTTGQIPGTGVRAATSAIPAVPCPPNLWGGGAGAAATATNGGGGGGASTALGQGSVASGVNGASGTAAGINGTAATQPGCGGGGGGGGAPGGAGGNGAAGGNGLVEFSWGG